jgi:hypothetical protein
LPLGVDLLVKEHFDSVQGTAEGLKSIFRRLVILMYFGAPERVKILKVGSEDGAAGLVYRIILISKLREPFPGKVLSKTGAWLEIHCRNTLETVKKLFAWVCVGFRGFTVSHGKAKNRFPWFFSVLPG